MTRGLARIGSGVLSVVGLLAAAPAIADDVGNDPACIEIRTFAQFDAPAVRTHERGPDPNDPLGQTQTSDLSLASVPCQIEASDIATELMCGGTIDPNDFAGLAAFTRDCTADLTTKTSTANEGRRYYFWYRSGVMLKMSNTGNALTMRFVY